MAKRKLGRPSNQRKALLRNQVDQPALVWKNRNDARAREGSQLCCGAPDRACRAYL